MLLIVALVIIWTVMGGRSSTRLTDKNGDPGADAGGQATQTDCRAILTYDNWTLPILMTGHSRRCDPGPLTSELPQ
jgi:hypothetical protein